MIRRLARALRNLGRGAALDRDLDDELRATLALLVDEKVRAGMSEADAARAARLELGGVEPVKEAVRSVRGGAHVEIFWRDLRLASRLLARSPIFALTATLSIALGVGATTAVFTIANALLMRTAPGVARPEELVDIVARRGTAPELVMLAYPAYEQLRRETTTLDGVYGFQLELTASSMRVAPEGGSERVFAGIVTSNYFSVLGVRAAAGRFFQLADGERPDAAPLIVLSDRFWTQRFNRSPDAIGQTVRINDRPMTIVGVAAPEFRGTTVLAPDLWVPTSMLAAISPEAGGRAFTSWDAGWLMAGGRLAPGITRAQATTDVARVAATFPAGPAPPRPRRSGVRERDPLASLLWTVERSSPLPFVIRRLISGFFVLLLAIVGVVLAIASANVAGVLLARGVARRREMAVRLATGAARGRLIRQLLTETLLLFAAGGVAGLALARGITAFVVRVLPAFPLPVNVAMPLDWRVAAFAFASALIAAIVAGLAPAFHATKADVVVSLKADAAGVADRLRLRNVFVVAQVALAMVLVLVGTTLARGLHAITSVDHGFDATGVEATTISLPTAGAASAAGFTRDLLERVRSLPGVLSAAVANQAPGDGVMSLGTIRAAVQDEAAFARWTLVEPGYFAALRIALVSGRDVAPTDRDGTPPVAIVSETTARRLWPDGEAVGRALFADVNTSQPGVSASTRLLVIGVAKDVRLGAGGDDMLAIYVPLQQHFRAQFTLLARVDGNRSIASDVRGLVRSLAADAVIVGEARLDAAQRGPVETQLRVAAAVAASVGLVGVLLAAIGVYGVTAYTVERRTREIGIRLSLGARRADVVRLVLGQGMALMAIGAVGGLLLGGGASRLLAASQPGVRPADTLTYAGVTALFVVVGLAACYVPVRRASQVAASDALRSE